MTLLRVAGLRKAYGGLRAVDGVGFALRAGEMLAVIGPNGAGKSTAFDLIAGQQRADAGSVVLDGAQLLGRPARAIARLGVGRTFQIAATFASLTVVENVQAALLAADGKTYAPWRRAAAWRRVDALDRLERVGLRGAADRPCSQLAYADLKRVELALALAADPKLLLMDEPTAGMAPAERDALMAAVRREVDERGLAVLFTEHAMDVVFAHADRIIVLARGQVIADGPPDAVRANPEVQAVYLGTGAAAGGEAAPTAVVGGGAAPPPVAAAPPAVAGAASGAPLLVVEGLGGGYGAVPVVAGIDLRVGRGEVVALVGRNGAGKSTTLKAIAGLLDRREGRVTLLGRDVSRAAPYEVARLGIGYVPEDRRVFADLTVRENLEVGRQPPRRGDDGADAAPAWTVESLFRLFPNLAAMPDRRGGRMSGGEQQMLTVARTLMGNPRVLLLDEPSEGVAPIVVAQMAAAIRTLKAAGIAILLSEQNLRFVEGVADRACLLERGRIGWHGPMTTLVADDALRRRYLGV